MISVMHSHDLLLVFGAALVLQNPNLSFCGGGGGLVIVFILCTLFDDGTD